MTRAVDQSDTSPPTFSISSFLSRCVILDRDVTDEVLPPR